MKTIDEAKLTKLYYSIGEVADLFDISTSLIRYWESEFSILKPHKNSKGDRRFTKENIKQLALVYHLVKERGFTLDGAKQEVKAEKKRIEYIENIKNKLVMLKNKLQDIRDSKAEE